MKKTILLSGLFLGLMTTSCGEQSEDEKDTEIKVNDVVNCVYTFNNAETNLDWTAYKFTKRTGVSGTFTHMQFDGKLKGAVPKEIIESIQFSIPTATVETNDPGRNKKVDSLFFDNLENTDLITGKVIALKDDGTAVVSIEMNNIEKEVVGDYELNDNVFKFTTSINVKDWNAQKQLETLNVACKDLHTDVESGETKSVLWPDISISFSTKLTKVCD